MVFVEGVAEVAKDTVGVTLPAAILRRGRNQGLAPAAFALHWAMPITTQVISDLHKHGATAENGLAYPFAVIADVVGLMGKGMSLVAPLSALYVIPTVNAVENTIARVTRTAWHAATSRRK